MHNDHSYDNKCAQFELSQQNQLLNQGKYFIIRIRHYSMMRMKGKVIILMTYPYPFHEEFTKEELTGVLALLPELLGR